MRVVINTLYLRAMNLSGSWTYTSQLVWHLTRQVAGHEFYVLVNENIADQLPVSDVAGRRVIVPVNARRRALRVVWENTILRSIIRRCKPDLVHSGGNILPLGVPQPAVVTVHDLQFVHYPHYFGVLHRAYFSRLLPSTMRRAARIIAVSHATAQDIVHSFGVDPGKIAVIHEAGLLPQEKGSEACGDHVRERLHLERPYLLSVGTSHPHKNLVRMVDAFRAIAGDVREDLVIVGEAFNMRANLLRQLEGTDLLATGRVKLFGFVPRNELLDLYAGATAFVFPSLFEGFGIPALEAMECRCPVVASRATSLPEVVGDAALLFDPTDTDDMATKLRRICLEPDLHARLVTEGVARARTFSWERMARETLQVYEGVHEQCKHGTLK